MENDPITMSDIVRALFEILISTAIGFSLFIGGYHVYSSLRPKINRKFEKMKRKIECKTMLNTLNLSVINDDIKDIVYSIELYNYEEADDKEDVAKRFVEKVSYLIYRRYYTDYCLLMARRYYTFLSEGVSGSVDNVSTVYLKTLTELREEVEKKKYMSSEDKAEYTKREKKLIALIEEEIDKNFKKVKEMKHSKNQSALDKADYIIKNGGIR